MTPKVEALIFIFGNIIRSGKEEWVEIGFPRYEKLEFNP